MKRNANLMIVFVTAVCLIMSSALALRGQSQIVATGARPQNATEAPTGFDDQTNGLVDQATHADNMSDFQEVDDAARGLGPLFNQTSCANCHSGPRVGGGSNVTELRAGHRDSSGNFVNPTIVINGGKDVITGRSLINQFAICKKAKEVLPRSENIRALRISVSTLGDGFIEAVDDQTILDIAQRQRAATGGLIHGQAIKVDVLESTGTQRIGRFGWKAQHASLVSFAADAYLNEQGITSSLLPLDITSVCDAVADPEDAVVEGLADIDHFAEFIRATKAPPVDATVAATPDAKAGAVLFDKIGCGLCHVSIMTTAPTGTAINGSRFILPDALGNKTFHPYSDLLLHNVGTGDGIVQNGGQSTANKLRTPPLWGVRLRTRLMHDGKSTSTNSAILRHGGEAGFVSERYRRLPTTQKGQLLKFLASL